jgi:hypothetical protein
MRQLRGEKSSSSRRLHHTERYRDKDRDNRDRSPRHLREERTSSRRSKSDSYRDRDDERRRRHRYRDESGSDSDREKPTRSHRRHRDDDKRPRRTRDYSNSPHRSSRHRKDEQNDRHSRHRRSDRSRSRSPRPSRHLKEDQRKAEKSTSGNSHRYGSEPERTPKEHDLDDDSDPLEDLVGPLPASSRRKGIVASRGRGSYRENTSTIDSHFARDYDPKLDVHLSEDENSKQPTRRSVAGLMTEGDDWDMALEALRDRAEWKKKGEERLRVAGFDSDVVDKWKSHPSFSLGATSSSHDTEGNVEDVRWAKKGEGREWDRGKVMNEDGVYDIKAQWS